MKLRPVQESPGFIRGEDVNLTTRITVSGGHDPGVYDQTVTLGVTGSVVTIRTWGMTHG